MRKIYSLFFILFAFVSYSAQATGIFESYAVLKINGGVNTYYDLQASTTNLDFNGLDLGTFTNGQTLVFVGGENKTWKNGGGDVTGGRIHYRVYTGTPSGSFSNVSFNWIQDLGNGDQKWGATTGTTDVLSGLPNGVYILEVYTEADTNLGARYSNNGGANYKATFTVSNTLATGENAKKAKSFVSEGKLYTNKQGNLSVQVVDFSGRIIKTITTKASSNGIELNLPKKGNYILKLNDEVIKFAY
ncbi:T9SS type A sorting domain-containing protein [Cloacibacterium normanense]